MIENRGLQNVIFEVRIPLMTTVEVDAGVEKEKEEKIFPCYVLVKMEMSDATWHVVRNITGVTGFVGPASEPVPLSDAEVAALGVEKRTVEISYQVGDLVKITSGPLKGMEGSVISIDTEAGVVNVKISMLGQEIPAEMELDQVIPAF